MTIIFARPRGKDIDRTNPITRMLCEIPWPEGSISACRELPHHPFQYRFISDVLKEKRERMEQHLWWKREYGLTEQRYLYVWVFFIPGLIYGGWWLYLIGRNWDGGQKTQWETPIISRLMELFPIVKSKMLFDPPDVFEWMMEFVKQYPRGISHSGKPQGKAAVLAEFHNGNFVQILKRAEWPKRKGGEG